MQNLKTRLKNIYRKFRSVWKLIKHFFEINWHKTIYFNFKMLPLSSAIKLPVYFWGPVRFTNLRGNLIINSPIRKNMVSFGKNLEFIQSRIGTAEIRIEGTFIINGGFITSNDCKIIVLKNAILEIGEGSHLGSRTVVFATNRIKLGKNFRLSYDSQVIDSNFHYIQNLETNKVKRPDFEIIIGDYCWVGNRSSIMKGTKTPTNLIIATNSMLNKDYTLIVPENSIIGGIPAKLIQKNKARIYNPILEDKINRYFIDNPDKEYFSL